MLSFIAFRSYRSRAFALHQVSTFASEILCCLRNYLVEIISMIQYVAPLSFDSRLLGFIGPVPPPAQDKRIRSRKYHSAQEYYCQQKPTSLNILFSIIYIHHKISFLVIPLKRQIMNVIFIIEY